MKKIPLSLILFCLLLFVLARQSAIVWAQESPQVQQDKERHKNNLRSSWDGGGAIVSSESLLRDPAFRAALGVTDNYYQEILTKVKNAKGHVADDPEFQKAEQEFEEAHQAWTGTPYRSDNSIVFRREGDEEAYNRVKEAEEKLDRVWREFALGTDQRSIAAFEEALSSEFKQKIQEAWLAAMGETSTISPRWFEVLNLTDAQRQQMEQIKKELEPELEKRLEIYGNNAAKILERVNAALRQRQEAGISFSGSGNAQEALNAFMKNLQEEPEHKKLLDESYASSKAFATLFRKRMSEILTDDQRSRLQELIDNPPPHAQLLIQRLRKENWGQYKEGEIKKVDGKDVWVPGPDSWKPGDPLPETIPQEKESKGSFPRQTE